jgi:ferredoxin-NADP reductase
VKVIFKKKFTESGNAVSFILEPEKPVDWEAGQYTSYELPGLPPSNDERTFTISSAPYEGHFQITTRITDSAFKQRLNTLEPGTEIEADQVGGDFTWVDTDRPIIFVAGGIGVTPYHSILKQRVHDNKPLSVTLLYATRDDKIVFKAELDKLASTHPEFGLHYVTGERLNADKMKVLAPKLSQSLIYLSGPEPMVDEFEQQLTAFGIAKDQLKQDWFPGYTDKTY